MTAQAIDIFLAYLKQELCNLSYNKLPMKDFIDRIRDKYETLKPELSNEDRLRIENMLEQVISEKQIPRGAEHSWYAIQVIVITLIYVFHVDSLVPESIPRELARELKQWRHYWTKLKGKVVLLKFKGEYGHLVLSTDRKDVYSYPHEDEILAFEINLRMLKAGVEVIDENDELYQLQLAKRAKALGKKYP